MPHLRFPFIGLFVVLAMSAGTTVEAQKKCQKGIPCGNSCISVTKVCRISVAPPPTDTLSPKTTDTATASPASKASASASAKTDSASVGSTTKVWINTKSHVFHCPGTKYYGATASGKYATEKEALVAGNRPANGRKCG